MKKNKIDILKYSAIYLLIVMGVLLLLSSILFILHISLSSYHLVISIILSLFNLLIFDKFLHVNKTVLVKSFILSLLVLIISITSMNFIYDRSSDGNTYHKDAIGNLYLGWNPVYESSTDFLNDKQIDNYDINSYDIWKDHYAKANWILEASIYKTTNNIESGKAINLIFMYILFGLSFSYFKSKIGNSAIILSLITTFNPITCNQLFTFYNDQLGVSLLFILLISLIGIVDKKNKNNLIFNFIVLSITFILITNIKFNIMGYGLIFTFIFMLYYLYIKYKNHLFLSTIKKLVPLYIILFIISFGIVGYSTYIKNYIDHDNFFYPVYGEESEDIITAQQPEDFTSKNVVEKFFIGTFARVNNLQNDKDYEFKIPFTFNLNEIKESSSVDTRLGGFGIFSSGLFILAIISLVLYFKKSKNVCEKQIIGLLIGCSTLIILVISESWWARYTPSNYIFIILLSYLILFYKNNKKYINIIKYITLSIIIINSLIILLANTYYSCKSSISINKDLNKLKGQSVNISFNMSNMTGILYNLDDYNIKYNLVSNDLSNLTYYKYLNYEVIDNEK